ncbi:hypothetical protein AA0242T_0429 [Acetobacter aceti NRIC 0242]|uniref:Uncharacterized protein n=1 Tax=Acetobacter aceti NBRC 14818 TaxID=887700 RepID=A0AB33IJ66_ACEAC|nr:hypothetical protein EMQ_2467 [Acetobacter aceti NBRC 14818]GAN56301.1 hypothetical protein Abac_006_029 [Acetobacter aceti NBRC 14818]GBO79727.1 hypothetical protein AA0242T_0429 [Acetobacter aceti NRIC 0242]
MSDLPRIRASETRKAENSFPLAVDFHKTDREIDDSNNNIGGDNSRIKKEDASSLVYCRESDNSDQDSRDFRYTKRNL